MAVIKSTPSERDLLARIMRAEALSEGNLGMLMVGNVVINRAISDCLNFDKINTIQDAIYQENQFSGINSPLFFSNPTTTEKKLADRVIKGEYYYPATNSLWFKASKSDCPKSWYNQPLAGKYKNHCFYIPNDNSCR